VSVYRAWCPATGHTPSRPTRAGDEPPRRARATPLRAPRRAVRERHAWVSVHTRAAYLIWSYSENIGMYIAMTMKPTIAPTTMIMIGSMIAVSDLTAAST
jgi:hypothetical protein